MKPAPLIIKESVVRPIDYSKIKHARKNYGHHAEEEIEEEVRSREDPTERVTQNNAEKR